jgi:hypothetical protein
MSLGIGTFDPDIINITDFLRTIDETHDIEETIQKFAVNLKTEREMSGYADIA